MAAYNPELLIIQKKMLVPRGIGPIHRVIKYQLCENVYIFNFRRVIGMYDLGECQSLNANNLLSYFYLSHVLCLFDLESDKLRS